MADNTTLSDFLAELGVDINNMQEFLLKLNQMLTTSAPTVTFTQTLANGTVSQIPIASHAYLVSRITDIDNKFNALLNANGNRVSVISNGITKSFELQDISAVIKDLNSVSEKTVTNPEYFNIKTNWFFESFLSPLVYIDLDVSTLITSDVDKFEITRIIIPNTPAAITYFDNTYKGQNNLVYNTVLTNLGNNNIAYTVDVNEQSLPPASSKNSGNFQITNLISSNVIENIAGQISVIPVNSYTLNTINYTEYVEGTVGSIQKTLAIGDILLTSNNSEYRITSINLNTSSVILTKAYGIEAIAIGSVISIKPDLLIVDKLQVNVGFNERQLLFFRPISTRLKATTSQYSQGFGIYTNDLKIQSLGTELTLAQYYQGFISDFSLLFTEYSREKKIPASIGVVPTAPTLSAAQFIVSQDNDHIKQDTDVNNVKASIASLETIKTQIAEKDSQINLLRIEINTNSQLTPAAKAQKTLDLKTKTDQRATLSTQYSSTISTITTAISTVPALIKPPVYSVKGMWAIPAASPSPDGYGLQEIVQFKVSYRVLSSSGQAAVANQISIQNADGSISVGSFSPSKEIITKARSKVYNSATGFYQWAVENIVDSNIVNSNQIEIPIGKGETIEIKIKSLSEAGWPDSPVESVFSNIITIPFPQNLEVVEDASVVSQRIFAEEAKINFKTELAAQGLDIHLGTAFSQADKYYAHRAEDIASGFFSIGGGIINLFSKLQTISNTIESIQNTLASGTGTLKVSIIEGTSQITVNNGQTIELDAGNYKDQIQNGIKLDHGNIITRQYIIQLENTSQTALQLISALNGALGQIATISNPINSPSEPYHTSLRYDLSPLVINSNLAGTIGDFKQVNGYQSSQAKGQIIYNRAKSVDLSNNLIEGDRIALTPQDPDNISYNTTDTEYINYNYQGNVINGTTVPYSLGHYLPFDPTLATLTIQKNSLPNQLSVNPTVWNGTLDQNQAPVGYGILSEFCISIENPAIKVNGAYNNNWNEIYRPTNQATLTSQKTLPFSHAIHFETSENEIFNAFGAKHFQQAAYRLPVAPTPANQLLTFKEINSPIKTSFNDNDKYLIGKYTCGSYLFISPSSYQAIGSNAVSPTITKRTVEFGTPNAIQIPLKFQYRASDYLANIGGYRPNETLTNIRYSKKLGLDIYLKDETFSFDILAKVKYQSETASVTPLSPIAQSGAISQSDLVAVVGGG